jgi:prophage DNA circulation protein
MGWANDLQQGSYRGVQFGVLSSSDTIERRVVDAEIPYRNGGEQDDLGRKPRPTTLRAVLHGPDYLAQLGALQLAVDDATAGTFVHPLLGQWQARVVRMQVEHEASQRDHCVVTLELREDGLDVDLPTLFSVTAAAESLAQQSSRATSAAEAAGVDVSAATSDAERFAADLESAMTELDTRFEQLRSRANEAIAVIEQAVDDVTGFETICRLRLLVLEALRLRDRMRAVRPRVEQRTVRAGTSLASLLGDADQVEDTESLNRIRNPFAVPAGTEVRVYAR